MNLFDASALLCFLIGEPGHEIVERELAFSSRCSAANWSEVAQKHLAHSQDWELSKSLLLSYGLEVEPVTRSDGELAAKLWKRGGGLSLGDRICLAAGERIDATIWTADRAWGSHGRIRQVR